jgi:hypothetical protein
MEVQEILDEARKSVGAKGVYAEPYVQNGLTVIPAATVAGGGGAGSGESPDGHGGGGGFGVKSRPSGAWVIENGVVRWKTAFDLNRIVIGAELVALAGVFAARTIFRPQPTARRTTRLLRPHVPRLRLPRVRGPHLGRRTRRIPVVHLTLPHIPAIRR